VSDVPLQSGKVNEDEGRWNAFIKNASSDKPFRISPSHHFHLSFAIVPATMVAHSICPRLSGVQPSNRTEGGKIEVRKSHQSVF